jgi:hypothetical protein
MTTPRLVGAILAAALLPSCGYDRHDPEGWIHGTVNNEGTVPADVWAGTEDYYDSSYILDQVNLTVEPNASIQFQFRRGDVGALKVVISRSTDHFQIFDGHWDGHDLVDLNWHVTITVHP